MEISDSLMPLATEYLWVLYAVFVFVVVAITIALLYHWATYEQVRKLRFRFVQLIFLLVLFFLLTLSWGFFVKI